MNIDDKRNYIYENIYKLNDHKNLLKIVKSSECKYTENKNGIFLNLNTLDDDLINNIYFLVHNDINSDLLSNLSDTEDNESIELKEIVSKGINNINKKGNIYTLDSFNDNEQEIIKTSKLYRL